MLASNFVRKSAIVGVLSLGLAACSEGPTSPVGISPDVAPLMSSGSDGSSSHSGRGQDIGSVTFTIWPGLAIGQKFGDHVLFIPANAVCDPATSGYGSALWDVPCAPLSQPIQVTATWSTRNDQPVVSFSPDLRFAPSDDESRWVKLSLKASRGIDPDLYYAILWYDTAAGRWVDESQTDPSLRARTNQSGNMVTRRLKHFSDYELWSGFGSFNVTSGTGDAVAIDLGGW